MSTNTVGSGSRNTRRSVSVEAPEADNSAAAHKQFQQKRERDRQKERSVEIFEVNFRSGFAFLVMSWRTEPTFKNSQLPTRL